MKHRVNWRFVALALYAARNGACDQVPRVDEKGKDRQTRTDWNTGRRTYCSWFSGQSFSDFEYHADQCRFGQALRTCFAKFGPEELAVMAEKFDSSGVRSPQSWPGHA